jgi:hypothetical protein
MSEAHTPGVDPALARVERATVQLTTKGGRGVLIPGGYVLTAAHCVGWDLGCGMALGRDYFEPVLTADGRELQLDVLAVEPVADIAVLSCPDEERLPELADAFDEFRRAVEPVPLFRGEFQPADVQPGSPAPYTLPLLVYGHDRRWIKAAASGFCAGQSRFEMAAEEYIAGGASGGPIVTADGQLVGVMSISGEQPVPIWGSRVYTGKAARPLYALPVWVVEAISAA